MSLSPWGAALWGLLGPSAWGPGSLAPNLVLFQMGGDPSVSVGASWRSRSSEGALEVRPASGGEVLSSRSASQDASLEGREAGRFHQATVEGLKPGGFYRWRVASQGFSTPWRLFRTAETRPSDFEFLVMGDAQALITSVSAPLFARAAEESPEARFVLHVGDMIDDNLSLSEWEEWIRACSVFPSSPTLAVPGNHEYGGYGRAKLKGLSPLYLPVILPIKETSPELPRTTWKVDYQGVRIVGLDSSRPLEPQVSWMESLGEPAPRWLIVMLHHPVHPSMRGQEAPGRTRLLQQAFERLGVDLVFTGHLHSYARSGLVKGGSWNSPEGGVVYMISNSGGKHYRQDDMPWIRKGISKLTSFARIKASPDALRVESVDRGGVVHDRFILKGGGDAITRLEEPPVP